MKNTTTNTRKTCGYGTALLFKHTTKGHTSALLAHMLKTRSLKPEDCLDHYIENTNLHSLPPNCFGTLIAYTTDKLGLDHHTRQSKELSDGTNTFLWYARALR